MEQRKLAPKRESITPSSIRELLDEFPMFSDLTPAVYSKMCADFEGPFRATPGHTLFHQGDEGDYVYFVLAGEVEMRGNGKLLNHLQRGDFVGVASLLGPAPSSRLCSARIKQDCALLRMTHQDFRESLSLRGGLSILAAPSCMRYLNDMKLPLSEPALADSYAIGALWCQLVAGSRPAPLARVRQADSIESLRAAVSARNVGNFYFAVEEKRVAALVGLLICRRAPHEALQCLEQPDEADDLRHSAREEPGPQQDSSTAWLMRGLADAQEAARSMVELNPTAELASDAVMLSARAAESTIEQWERLQNLATTRYGEFIGEFLGNVYGGLFAKDLLWMFRASSRTPRFPVLLVRDAEDGNLLARWKIAASLAFESELCQRSAPLVVPSIRPAFTAGYEIGAAVGRNRAMNFKILFIDAFLGSVVKQLTAELRIRLQRMKRSVVRWDALREVLRDAIARGRSARLAILLRYGVLPTSYDQNAPKVLKLLPSTWVPDIGLPLASGIGRGFFKRFWRGWRNGWRQRYVRPKFETWDVDDVPTFVREFARRQGEEQAGLVASSVGDTVARDAGLQFGRLVGVASGWLMIVCGRKPEACGERVAVAGGQLQTDEELAMARCT